MEQIGRMPKFKVNRELTDEERESQFKPYTYNQGDPPQSAFEYLTTIKINSSFLELTDRCFFSRGTLTMVGLTFLGFGLAITIALMVITINIPMITLILGLTLPFAMCYGSAYLFLAGELYNLTHNPIRFDRRNRMVYAFLYNQEMVAAPWDEVFFCIGGDSYLGMAELDIQGHIMADDGVTVKATFSLGYQTSNKYELQDYWNFINHYMEKGPKELVPNIALYLPIADHKEPSAWAFNHALLGGSGYILFPLTVIIWLCRLLAMGTSTVPVWPDWVEEKCQIDPDDPYARDDSLNPPIEYFTNLEKILWAAKAPAFQATHDIEDSGHDTKDSGHDTKDSGHDTEDSKDNTKVNLKK